MKTILIHSISVSVAFVMMVLFWPTKEVKIRIPASQVQVDSLAAEKFSVAMSGVQRSFTSETYKTFIDSLIRSSRRVIKIKGETIHDTTYINIDCIPIIPGKYSSTFKHIFNYPEGDTTTVRVSLEYVQRDSILHPDGHFENFDILMPEISRTFQVKKQSSFISKYGSKVLFFGAGIIIGRL